MKNKQPISKQELSGGLSLALVNIFGTLQGEGPYSGQRAVFVRLAGCNLQCPNCDTEYTCGAKHTTTQDILERIAQESVLLSVDSPTILVVITGGEPLRQNIGPLVLALLEAGKVVQVETNGSLYQALPYTHPNFHIVCSPKTSRIHKELEPHIGTYKYVIGETAGDPKRRGLPTSALGRESKSNLALPPRSFPPQRVFLTPEEVTTGNDSYVPVKHLKSIVHLAQTYGYTAQVQLHKHLGVK